MKKSKVLTNIIAAGLAVVCITSASSMTMVCSAANDADLVESVYTYKNKTGFAGLVDKKLAEAMKSYDAADAELESIKKAIGEALEMVATEADESYSLRKTMEALKKAEALADELMAAQSDEKVAELASSLALATEFLCKGSDETKGKNAFEVIYDYMKKDSMFCGEAANKAEDYWKYMKEAYSKSGLALVYALSQKSDTAEEIEKVKDDCERVAVAYEEMVQTAEGERTVYINKGKEHIKLSEKLGSVDFFDFGTYASFINNEGFGKAGITNDIYQKTVRETSTYYYSNGWRWVDISGLMYEGFARNISSCVLYSKFYTSKGIDVQKETKWWRDYSDKVFKNVMLNLKAQVYNSANRIENGMTKSIIEHISSEYKTKSIAAYLEEIGFDFGGRDLSEEKINLLLTGNMTTGDGLTKSFGNEGKAYDMTSLSKQNGNLKDYFTPGKTSASVLFFEYAEKTLPITIESHDMDGRISKGVYTIKAKQLAGYDKENNPVYVPYERVCEVKGSKMMTVRIPLSIDFSSLEITLGYEGIGASSNHKNVCSFRFSDRTYGEDYSQITLKMVGFTKFWLGYGVKAEIFCDSTCVAEGNG